ncbi:cytochrome P450 6k1-like [Temnothorax longispinosus]|uniref:cytochrome P450 6k1-like n=1 Tax=Temnothorax longispinosus TaxID=300112 RepID=UPI003A99DBF2
MAFMTDYWILDGTIIVTILIISYYFLMTGNFKYWEKRGVLEITPTIFDGNFKECLNREKAPSYFLKELYDRAKDNSKPYIGFYISDVPFLLLRNREIINHVLITDFHYFCDRYSSADPKDRVGYANLFFIKNPSWMKLKTKLMPFFNNSTLEKMFALMLECGKHLNKYIDSLKLHGNGQIIDVMDVSSKLNMDVIWSTAYGLDANMFKDPNFSKLGKIMLKDKYNRGYKMLHMFFLPHATSMGKLKVFQNETTDLLRKIFWHTMTRRMKSGEKRNDLIDILIELKRNSSYEERIEDFTFDDDDLLAQAASFFLFGFETCSTTTAFALYQLAVQPEIQKTLRKELLKALEKSNGKITYDMIQTSLPYLDMVISETLRLYPPLGFLNRMATKNYKVPEYDFVIEKGTPVYISILGLHYDPEYFPSPNIFDPERFNEENKRNRPSCVYFPFGEGPHECIGRRFGLLQIKLTLLIILSKYEVKSCEKTSVKIDPKEPMTLPLNGILYLNVRKINTNAI